MGAIKTAALDTLGTVRAVTQQINNSSSRAVEVYQGGTSVSPNQVAAAPRFTPPATPIVPYAGGPGGPGGPGGRGPGSFGGFGYGDDDDDNKVFKQPMSYGRNLTNYVKQNPAAAMLYAGAVGAGALSSTEEVTQAELMLQGAAFFSGDYNGTTRRYRGNVELGFPFNKNFRTGGSSDYETMGRFQSDIARTGTVNNKMDAMTALVAAQSYGLTGGNFTQGAAGGLQGSVMGGIANVSNLLPGAGIEGTTRAYGAMQSANNVNMLRGIGIRIRDEDGNMKPPDQIIDDIWKKICKDYAQAYGSSKTPSQREVMIGLQPGNSLYSMLDIYFGGDPILRQMMINGLIFKARMGAGTAITKDTALDAGASTESVVAKSQQNATAAQGLFQVAKAGSSGFKNATQTLTIGGLLMNQLDNVSGLLKGATYTKSFAETMLNGGNGMGQDLAKGLLSVLGLGGGKAKGGKVNDEIPYIVGELGPELFIPKTDGVIIPNHLTGRRNRHQGGGVHAAHEGRTLAEAEVRNILAQAGFEGQDLENAVDVARAESGFRTNAEGDKTLTSNTWDYSIGLFQIRSLKDWKKFNDPKREPLGLYDPLTNAKAAKQIFDGSGRWDPAWTNTAAKLGLTGVESGGSPNPEMVDESIGVPTQENGEIDYIAQLGAAATSGALQEKLKTFNPSSLSSSQLSQYFGSSGFDSSKPTTAHNYGGVTININAAAASANEVYKIIEKMLTEGALMQSAASK
jgi:hypothetical protein